MSERNPLFIPWSEKRKEIEEILGDEELLAKAWELDEEFIFYFLMLLATY